MTSRALPAITALVLTLGVAGCDRGSESSTPLYEAVPVERRNIVVAVEAAGTIEPVTTVELKSKASGEVLDITAETGDEVAVGALLVKIDPRTARNRLDQTQADLTAARARLSIAKAQQERAETLLQQGILSKPDYEKAALELATSQAQVVAGQVSVENARIALNDTEIRAPIAGTIIEKKVETGQVISSPTQDVGGGTLLLKMADLLQVQVRVLVDETDIGKITPGLPASVRMLLAHPARPDLDQAVVLRRTGEGAYEGALAPLVPGRWLVTLEDEEKSWRLVGIWKLPQEKAARLQVAGNQEQRR